MTGPNVPWQEPPDGLTLSREEVHVWRAALDRPQRVRDLLTTRLSDGERDRARRILPPRNRERWAVARALLRVILGRYLGTSPEEVTLAGDAVGRTALAGQSDPTPVSFNLSHSGDVALYVIAVATRVGVDVERVRDDVDTERIAARLFTAVERAALQGIPEEERRRAFFSAWARKEACAKAVGAGLPALFAGFSVSLEAKNHSEPIRGPGEGLPGGPWTLWELVVKRGYAAAVVAEGRGLVLRCLDLTREEGRLLRGPLPQPAGD